MVCVCVCVCAHCSLVARYCFVEFIDSSAARQALESLNSHPIPGTNGVPLPFAIYQCIVLSFLLQSKRFKLNWANRKADSG